ASLVPEPVPELKRRTGGARQISARKPGSRNKLRQRRPRRPSLDARAAPLRSTLSVHLPAGNASPRPWAQWGVLAVVGENDRLGSSIEMRVPPPGRLSV